MSRPPPNARSSVASGLAPPGPPPGYPTSTHGSAIFPHPPPMSVYEPPALKDWTFDTEFVPGSGGDGLMVVWTDRGGGSRKKGGQDKIPEARMSETEMVLLRQSPRVDDFVNGLKPPGAKHEKRRSKRPDVNGGTAPPMAGVDPRRRSAPPDGYPPVDTDDERRRRKRRESRDPDRQRRRRSRRYDD